MKLGFTPQEERFRGEAAAWLEAQLLLCGQLDRVLIVIPDDVDRNALRRASREREPMDRRGRRPFDRRRIVFTVANVGAFQ